ncbi:MAG: HD domain-containing protein [Patescibacteria group bacterium]
MKSSKLQDTFNLPKEVVTIAEALKKANFEAYLVGGCVRDTLLGRKPKDWDLTTNAAPEEIIKIFPKTFYENSYGTVGVVNEATEDETLKVVEITPYRLESQYNDFRRPSSVAWSDKLEDDLQRRDFTINAIALKVESEGGTPGTYKGQLIDPYKGQEDLASKTLRTVGDPHKRFSEDALRMLRAIRISTELGFSISSETIEAIAKYTPLLKEIAIERIREEFVRILMSDNPMSGIIMCQKLGILPFISHELEKAIGVEQNQAHSFDVWEHLLRALQHAADKGWSLEIRLAALFHDISKPETRRASHETKWTFYGHEVVGSRVTEKILTRLTFSKKIIEKVVKLVRWHMFFSDTEQITPSAVRRLVAKVGKDDVWELMNLRICDRIGTGRPKENPYRLRKYKSMIEEVMRDPVSVGMLKIDGNRLIEVTHVTPGPKIGRILLALLEEVLEKPELNTEEYLEKRALELSDVSDETLISLAEKAREAKEDFENKELGDIRGKYNVE